MKKLLFLITVLTMGLMAQSWDIERAISGVLPSSNYNSVNAVVKDAALNIVASSAQGVFYYKVKPSGTVLSSVQLDTSPAEYVQISESYGQLHVLYKSGTTLKYKYSANGSNWATLTSPYVFSSTNNGGMVTIVEQDIIRATVAKDSKVFYYEFNRSNLSLSYYKEITDYTQFTTVGNKPSMIINAGKVYVGYIETALSNPIANGRAIVRSFDLSSGMWSGMDLVSEDNYIYNQRLAIKDNYLNCIVLGLTKVGTYDNPDYRILLKYFKKDLQSGNWSGENIAQSSFNSREETLLTSINSTGDINILIEEAYGFTHYILAASGLTHIRSFSNNYGSPDNVCITKQNNELYLLMKDNNSSGLLFREYNYAPTQVVSLASSSGANNHPVISWSASPEPDVVTYNVYKDGQYIGYTTTNNYTDLAEVIVTGPVTDNETIKKYKVKAVDLGSMISPFSSELSVRIWQESLEKRGENGEDNDATTPSIYSLGDNYPNPFNPTTRFNFSIAQDENVRITVYSMLGEPVGELVNERLAAGEYSLSFDASSLASGTYIYVIKAGSFTQSKKMVLMK